MKQPFLTPNTQIANGFTLIELLVVIACLALLMGMGIPAWTALMRSQRHKAAEVLVQNVATAIAAYQQTSWSLPTLDAQGRPAVKAIPLWDWNSDQILDGDPLQAPTGDATLAATLTAAGYHGFLATSGFVAPKRAINATSKQVMDPWKQPLHFTWAKGRFGQAGFGVWSTGPDTLDGAADSPEAADNITSWGK